MDSKDVKQPEKKSETAEERTAQLEADLKKAKGYAKKEKKEKEKAKKEAKKAKKEAESAKKALDEEKKKGSEGAQKRKQEEEPAPTGPRQWKRPRREDRPQGNAGQWPLQATAAPFVPAWPSPSFTASEVQEATPMPMPQYLPPDYRQQWGMAGSFTGQVLVYRRYVEQNMTFYLAPPAGLSQELTRRWIGGTAEEQRQWAAQLELEQRAGGPGAPIVPPAYGAPGGAYGQPGFVVPLAPRAPPGRLFPEWPRAQNPPVANHTAPQRDTRPRANQWVSQDYPERQRVRADKLKKEREEKERKDREAKEKEDSKKQKNLEKNRASRQRKKERKQALKQAGGKDGEETKDEEMPDLSAPYSEVPGQTTESAITQAIASRRQGDEAALQGLQTRRDLLLVKPDGDLAAVDRRLVETLIKARQDMLEGLAQLQRQALDGMDEMTSVEAQIGQRIGTLANTLTNAVAAAQELHIAETLSFNEGRRAQAAAPGRLQIDQVAYAEGPSSDLPFRLALPQQTSFVIPGAELPSQDIGSSVVRGAQRQTRPQPRESVPGPLDSEDRIVDVEEEEALRDFHAYNTADLEDLENLLADDGVEGGPE